ncbi:hypothetical protein AYO49_00560 [Verrucomicrobiaceae bacterium SCGC AG-212-N21]|nr:hypothetical protein AYO49_00560 [Verrucomicrobiaceae bacterium SCGC AG-212-N21]
MKRFLLSLLLVHSTLLPAAETRNALVMGVWKYTDPAFPALPGIESDVTKMADKLKTVGFNVTVVTNPTLGQAKLAVDDFGAKLKADKGTGLFYYSGHGCENDGKNYLIPGGTTIRARNDLDDEALSAQRVLNRMEDAGTAVNLVFLDCCRNALTKGAGDLAPMRATGTFIGFATASAKVAGASQEGSAYTAALLEKLGTPGVSINDMHTMVTKRVMELTEGSQVPFQYSGLNVAFALVPAITDVTTPAPAMSEAEIQRRVDEELKKRMAPVTVQPSPPPSAPTTPTSPNLGNTHPLSTSDPAKATKSAPFVNSLGMKFVPVSGTKVLFCVHETRVGDFAAFVSGSASYDYSSGEAPHTLDELKPRREFSWRKPGFTQSDEHPVTCASWEDADAFCRWLSKMEGKTYRLPTDYEWSLAVGIGDQEGASATPESKSGKIEGLYPWGRSFPPRGVVGNYADSAAKAKDVGFARIEGYTDGYATTAPVMSFAANEQGLYDLGGNVSEWCIDWYSPLKKESRVVRGASWGSNEPAYMLSAARSGSPPTLRFVIIGFRVVLVVSGE